ncbi:MAG: DUF350 domain-containing protein [Elusimicrobiota bacterium]|jgi:uncharacterized membrane protein YjfL (UPF0719 family)
MTRLLVSLAEFGLSFFLAVLVVVVTYQGFLRLMPQMDGAEEIRKGNAAVALMLVSLMVGSALILQETIYPVRSILLLAFREPGRWTHFAKLAAYALGHLAFGFILAVLCVQGVLKVFEKLTGEMDEEEQIRKGNIAVAVMLSAVMIVLSLYMRQGVSAVTKALIPQAELGAMR